MTKTLYELFPPLSDNGHVITLQAEKVNQTTIDDRTYAFGASDGIVKFEGKPFAHNDVIVSSDGWQKVVSICKRGELNVIGGKPITVAELPSSIPLEWKGSEIPTVLESHPDNEIHLLRPCLYLPTPDPASGVHHDQPQLREGPNPLALTLTLTR